MKVKDFVDIIGLDYYVGVPDSLLRSLSDYLMDSYGLDSRHHLIAANEGNAVGLAAGYHLATGQTPVVYMQNSGIGNAVNPLASLLHEDVYSIPCLFVVGWRGEPGVSDEPQHVFQGKSTLPLLEALDITVSVVDKDTTVDELKDTLGAFKEEFLEGKQAALVVKKGALEPDKKMDYTNENDLCREEAIREIVSFCGDDMVVSTTGKTSRELFEIREQLQQGHEHDFLVVGSMGHTSSIALGIATNAQNKRVWCLDGDGSLLMHMGAMVLTGNIRPKNLIHVVFNNTAHESVGGMPTAVEGAKFDEIAKHCGYEYTAKASTKEELASALKQSIEKEALGFIEVDCSIGSRSDLGRPTTTPIENKHSFMKHISG